MPGAIDMRLKEDALFLDLPRARQGKYLVAAAVRQYRPAPSAELMQPARLFQHLETGPQVEMIGIAKDDLRPDIFRQLLLGYGFYTPRRADRHKDGSKDLSMIGTDGSGPGRRT